MSDFEKLLAMRADLGEMVTNCVPGPLKSFLVFAEMGVRAAAEAITPRSRLKNRCPHGERYEPRALRIRFRDWCKASLGRLKIPFNGYYLELPNFGNYPRTVIIGKGPPALPFLE